jgi:hypothetical protein
MFSVKVLRISRERLFGNGNCPVQIENHKGFLKLIPCRNFQSSVHEFSACNFKKSLKFSGLSVL